MKKFRGKDGRDEMNLVEFAYFTLSKRAPKNIYQIEFCDEQNSHGERVKRHVRIQGDPRYGLPTAREEELLLELLRIGKHFNDFRDPRVEFYQAELLD